MHAIKNPLLALAVAALGLASSSLGGCIGTNNPPPPTARPDTCGAHSLARQIGRPVTELTVPSGSRVIGPDTIITEDYVPQRLNVLVDGRGTVTGLHCG